MPSASDRPAAPKPPPDLKVYSALELAEATAGFSPLCLIGEGGFGKVYRAMVSCTPVAIKVLDHEGLQGLREFHNEMKLLAGLHHPHVVRLLGYAAEAPAAPAAAAPGAHHPAAGTGGCQALVYELMTRGNLEERLMHRGGPDALPWTVRVRVAAQTTCALAHLHSKSIIHRDIKPANVFLDADFNAKLGDIGLAVMDGLYAAGPGRSRGSRAAAAAGEGGGGGGCEQEAIGTWQYLAPEYHTQGRSSMRTDAYALGLTLLQLLTGTSKPGELVARAQAALEACTLATQFLDPAATSEGPWDLRIAERMVKLALWCCMHNPEQRPAMTTVCSDMQRLLAEMTGSDNN